MMQAKEPLIQLTGITKRFGSRLILDRVDMQIQPGQTVAIIGPSGGGKSTLLRCINALNDFEAGEVRVGEYCLQASASASVRSETARSIRRLVGMVFQDYALFPHLTVLGNVMEAPRRVLGQSRPQAEQLARELLARVGLADRAEAYPEQLSGGQKQRVAIARSLAMRPSILLCDEITAALDPELKNEVLSVLESLKQEGMTLIMVTHEIGFARRAADQVVLLAEGKPIEHGPPAEVLDRPRTERAKRFLECVLG